MPAAAAAPTRRIAGATAPPRTGNVAFDDWREKELERLAEERRKLDETLAEFDEYMRELRRAKDQEEFDRFMANRSRSTPAKQDKPSKASWAFSTTSIEPTAVSADLP